MGKSRDRTIDGSTPTAGDFEFGTLAIPLTLLCQCLSDETLKSVGPFYLVSMPGEVKDPTSPHWNRAHNWAKTLGANWLLDIFF